MNHLFNHQPLLAILAKVLDYSDLVNLSQIETRFDPALKERQQKLRIVQSWARKTSIILDQLNNLRELYLGGNQISEIPPTIGQLTNLRGLYLDGNRISEIPPEIGQLTNLQNLGLCMNQITEIPPAIGQLTNLQVLDLGRNKISEIPPAIGQLVNLRALFIDNNQITKIPPEIGQLTNLKTLGLSNNKISEIPPALCFAGKSVGFASAPTWGSGKEAFEKSLTRLRPETPVVLSEALAKRDNGQLTNLRELYLCNNEISEIPPDLFFKVAPEGSNSAPTWGSGKEAFEKSLTKREIGQLTNLQQLYLYGNRISEIPPTLKTLQIKIYI